MAVSTTSTTSGTGSAEKTVGSPGFKRTATAGGAATLVGIYAHPSPFTSEVRSARIWIPDGAWGTGVTFMGASSTHRSFTVNSNGTLGITVLKANVTHRVINGSVDVRAILPVNRPFWVRAVHNREVDVTFEWSDESVGRYEDVPPGSWRTIETVIDSQGAYSPYSPSTAFHLGTNSTGWVSNTAPRILGGYWEYDGVAVMSTDVPALVGQDLSGIWEDLVGPDVNWRWQGTAPTLWEWDSIDSGAATTSKVSTSGAGTSSRSGSGTVSSASSISASGSKTASGTGSTTAASGTSVTGFSAHANSGVIEHSTSTSGSGSGSRLGSGSATATSETSASGNATIERAGAGAVNSTLSATATGMKGASSAQALSASQTTSGVGIKTAASSAALWLAHMVLGTGIASRGGSGTVTGISATTGAGFKVLLEGDSPFDRTTASEFGDDSRAYINRIPTKVVV